MFGLTSSRKKHAKVFNCIATSLRIASRVEFMLTRPEMRVRERLHAGETVVPTFLTSDLWPVNGATFSNFELRQMEAALTSSFSSQLFPAQFRINPKSNGSLDVYIVPPNTRQKNEY